MFLSFALAAAIAAAPAVPQETRMVAFELREGERLLGSPRLQVRIGEPAEVSIAGSDGYRLSLILDPGPNAESYLVRSSLYRPAGSGWRLVAAPSLLVARGSEARATISDGYAFRFTVE